MSEIQFGGFETAKPQKEKDLPPRPMPQPLPTKAVSSWSPQVPEEQETGNSSTKRTVVNVVNIALPLIGLTLILGTIALVVWNVIQFYSN